MKYLTLCRHAKSSWKTPCDDFYRSLNRRGFVQVEQMASQPVNPVPDRIISSPAIRAYSTALHYVQGQQWPMSLLQLEPAIYEAESEGLKHLLRRQSETDQNLWLVGHNPGINHLIDELCGRNFDNVVTSGRVQLQLDIEVWQDLSDGCGVVLDWLVPEPVSD